MITQSFTTAKSLAELTPEERRLIEKRVQLRKELRKEYLRQVSDPHKHGQGGYLFDPALQRFQSARACYTEYFKPNPKNGLFVFAAVVAPIIGYALFLKKDREEFERKCRSGEIKYADRTFKLC